jgi:hypothetical protein
MVLWIVEPIRDREFVCAGWKHNPVLRQVGFVLLERKFNARIVIVASVLRENEDHGSFQFDAYS